MSVMDRKYLSRFLKKRVENYVNLFKYGPQQGTFDWVHSKKRTIGGSEMATIMGLNKYSSIQQLVAQKVGLQQFGGSVKTRWGNLFEPIIQNIVEWDLDTKIMGEEISIPGIVKNQSYSPDGIGVVETETTLTWLENIYTDKDNLGREGTITKIQKQKTVKEPAIALFEFKCPFNRLPNGKIPEYYEPQVKTGLDTIRDNFGYLSHMPSEADPELISEMDLFNDKTMCDFGIYIEAQFRKCAWEDLRGDNPNYDRDLTPGDLVTPKLPLAFGFVGFYINEKFAELFKCFDLALEISEAKIAAKVIAKDVAGIASNSDLSSMFPGRIITAPAVESILMCYSQLITELKKEYIEITPHEKLLYLSSLKAGDVNKYCELSDLGAAQMPLMEILFDAFQRGIICPYYSDVSYTDTPQQRSENGSYFPSLTKEEETRDKTLSSVENFISYCAKKNVDAIGVFPWKLFRLDYHRVEKEIGYVNKWKDKISETISIVNEINSINDPRMKILKFADFFGSTL